MSILKSVQNSFILAATLLAFSSPALAQSINFAVTSDINYLAGDVNEEASVGAKVLNGFIFEYC